MNNMLIVLVNEFKQMLTGKIKIVVCMLAALLVVCSCSPTRYKAPKKPHNSFKGGKKNRWMDQKRDNMRHF